MIGSIIPSKGQVIEMTLITLNRDIDQGYVVVGIYSTQEKADEARKKVVAVDASKGRLDSDRDYFFETIVLDEEP